MENSQKRCIDTLENSQNIYNALIYKGIYSETARTKDFTSLFKGVVAEQFAGQELIAYHNPYQKPNLFYWARESKNSNAEVDYLVQKNEKPIPIEVKSGPIGSLGTRV